MSKVGREGDQRVDCTCSRQGLLVLFLVALIEVVQISDVCGFDAHQAGETLHVFITEDKRPSQHRHQETLENVLKTPNLIRIVVLHPPSSFIRNTP